MEQPYTLHVGAATCLPSAQSQELLLTVPDVEGAYSIPYIQSASRLDLRIEFHDPNLQMVRLTLEKAGERIESATLRREQPTFRSSDLSQGEYALDLRGTDSGGRESTATRIEPIGIGSVIAAIGDSITEGYFGAACHREDLNLSATQFPPEDVSKDRRNFPQFAPTTSVHWPEINCMRSWMTDLNDLLTESLGQPVFIANEGLGGYQTSGYLKVMREDRNWRERMQLLKPNIWLVHLGVNDERARRNPEEVKKDLRSIVDILVDRHRAEPSRILLARPCFDYAEGAEPVLRAYCKAIEDLVEECGLSRGPDFFDAYSRDKEKLYGEDPVHPNQEGMRLMARLWHDAVIRGLGARVPLQAEVREDP